MRIGTFLMELAAVAVVLPLSAAVIDAAGELPPYLPAVKNFKRAETIAPSVVTAAGHRAAEFRDERTLNGIWRISGVEVSAEPFPDLTPQEAQTAAIDFDDSQFHSIEVPSNFFGKFKVQSKSKPYAKAWYRHTFELSAEDVASKRFILKFNRVAYEAVIFLNGVEIGSHHGSYTPFEVDATRAVRPGKNCLAVRVLVDNGPAHGVRKPATHVYGSQWWMGLIPGGVTGDVTLSLEPNIRVAAAYINPDLKAGAIRVDCRIDNQSGRDLQVTLGGIVTSAMKNSVRTPCGSSEKNLNLKPGDNLVELVVPLKNPNLWSVTEPYLYFLALSIRDGAKWIDMRPFRFGFREFRIQNGKFELNGKALPLFSENISAHEFEGDFTAEALDEKALRTLLGYRNRGYFILRTSHMPIRERVLELADECGVMIASEWAWAFTDRIDRERFPDVNNKELGEHVRHVYNHPSVVLWSLGNEVSHRVNGWISGIMDSQVEMVRSIDKQQRPTSSFSGSASIHSYGFNKLKTDLLDLHYYVGVSKKWVDAVPDFDNLYQELIKIYAPGKKELPIPLVAWELVGFSWGFRPDAAFRIGDVDGYMEYAKRNPSWGKPEGIGFTGSIGLAAALDPKRGQNYAQGIYMHRIFEQLRLDGRMAGFAPWHTLPDFDNSTLWTQEVYPALIAAGSLIPRHLFAGELNRFTYAVINDSGRTLDRLTLRLSLADSQGKEIPLKDESLKSPGPWETVRGELSLTLPKGVNGWRQLRLTLWEDGREIGRNYYDLYLADPAVRTQKIVAARPVLLWNAGHRENLQKTGEILADHGIEYRVIDSFNKLSGKELVIVPAELTQGARQDFYAGAGINEFLKNGGRLLILEQKNLQTRFPGGAALAPEDAAFVDLVSPEHPVIGNLDQRNFDTWANPEKNGLLIRNALAPISANAVALRGTMLGKRSLGMALMHAKVGAGEVLVSQLEAVRTHRTDSSAASYLTNLLAYAAGSARWDNVRPLVYAQTLDYKVAEKQMKIIDLSRFANRSFSDETADDGKGGWTDQGSNDFRTMPLGKQKVSGVMFEVLDPARNQNRSCLILRGTARTAFPAQIVGIPVDAYVSRMYFLHTSVWGSDTVTGAYRMNYSDGSHADLVLRGRRNIGDWWRNDILPDARPGITRTNSLGRSVCSFVAEWINPFPQKKVVSFDFLSAHALRDKAIDYLPGNEPVPILIAATAEVSADKPVELLGNGLRRVAPIGSYHLPDKGTTTLKGGVLTIRFPKTEGTRTPGAILFLDKSKLRDGVHSLTFEAATTTDFSIKVVIPGVKWRKNFSGILALNGDGKFHRYRMRFGQELRGGEVQSSNWLGECFIHYASGAGKDGCSVQIRNLRLE